MMVKKALSHTPIPFGRFKCGTALWQLYPPFDNYEICSALTLFSAPISFVAKRTHTSTLFTVFTCHTLPASLWKRSNGECGENCINKYQKREACGAFLKCVYGVWILKRCTFNVSTHWNASCRIQFQSLRGDCCLCMQRSTCTSFCERITNFLVELFSMA